MLHFPSSRTDSLNATQSKSHSNPLLLRIEEELHDARRVHSHGQEEDLRAALNMVISRVTELSSLLNEAYKAQADLEVQLNVAKSNLQLVISNNEMLEEALKRETNGHTQDVGWRRASGRGRDTCRRESDENLDHTDRNSSSAVSSPIPPPAPVPAPAQPPPSSVQDSRFFRFRFSGSNSSSRPTTRPTTPSGSKTPLAANNAHHLTSSSMPVLPTIASREIDELTSELEKERAARKTITEEKAALEGELESLSQALFEEANKMVATERMKRAETEDELREARQEQEALRSALRIIEGENSHLRGGNRTAPPSLPNTPATASTSPNQEADVELKSPLVFVSTRSRSSSQIALKSPITSPRSILQNSIILLPISPPQTTLQPSKALTELELEDKLEPFKLEQPDDASTTPIRSSFKIPPHLELGDGDANNSNNPPSLSSLISTSHFYEDVEPSPWADAQSEMRQFSYVSYDLS